MSAPIDVVDKAPSAPPPDAIKLTDRCDRCGAQAFVRVTIPTIEKAVDLLFCGHHYKQHAEKLTGLALNISDETDRINKRPSVSSA